MSSIKQTHTHENGKVCYEIVGRRSYSVIGVYRLFQKEVIMAYMPYSGHWYAFDPKTGKETGSFTKEFFLDHIVPFKLSELEYDSDCK